MEDDIMSITKADIVERIFKEANFSKKESQDLVDLVFKVIKDTLAKGEKVKISGFGNFVIRDKSTRVGRNPQTGEAMDISARRVLTFKPSQILKEDITERFGHRINDAGVENVNLAPLSMKSRALSSFLNNDDDFNDGDDDLESEEN
jgi:integration host factor subunit alpha